GLAKKHSFNGASRMIRTPEQIRKDIDTKQQELAHFIKSKEVDGGHDFDGDGIKALADRNDELNTLADELKSAENIAGALNGALQGMASNREVQRKYGFSGEGANGAPPAVKSLGEHFTESDAFKSVENMRGREFATSFELPAHALKATTTTTTALPYPA